MSPSRPGSNRPTVSAYFGVYTISTFIQDSRIKARPFRGRRSWNPESPFRKILLLIPVTTQPEHGISIQNYWLSFRTKWNEDPESRLSAPSQHFLNADESGKVVTGEGISSLMSRGYCSLKPASLKWY